MLSTVASFKKIGWQRTLVMVAAGLVGFALNLFPVYIFDGLWLFVGQIPALVAAILLGPLGGLVAAAGAIAGLTTSALTSSGQVTLTQGMTWTLLVLEAVAVGALSKRRHPQWAALLFWGLVGAPVLVVFLFIFRSMAPGDVTMVIIKNVVSGVFNVTVASVLAGRGYFATRSASERGSADTIVQRFNSRISAVVAVPVLVVLIVVSNVSQRSAERAAMERLELEAARGATTLDEYVTAHQRTINLIARTVELRAGETVQEQSQLLAAARASHSGFLTMFIADSVGVVRVVASETPLSAPTLAPVGDRPYFAEAMRTSLPYTSGAFQGRSFGHDIIAAISAPLISPQGHAFGIVEGSLNLGALNRVVAIPRDLELTIIDKVGHVVYSSAPTRHAALSDLPTFAGAAAARRGTLWNSDRRLITSRRETFFASAPTSIGWNVLVEVPRYVALRRAEANGTAVFVACLLLFAITMVAVRYVNGLVAEPLVELEAQAAALQWGTPLHEPGSAVRKIVPPREIAVVRTALLEAHRRITESFVATQRAISDRDAALKLRDQMLLDLDGVVRERTRQLETERDRAESSNKAKSTFLANMSHELRTPLNVVLGRTESLTEGVYGDLAPRQTDALMEVENQGRRLLSLINNILDLARIESGKVVVAMAPVNVRHLIEEIVAAFTDIVIARSVSLSVEAPESNCVVSADAFLLRQVMVNLVGNAIKFTPAGGHVAMVVVAGRDDHITEVRVQDNGIGISPDRLPLIFGAFEQADTSNTRAYGGTGLGLTISRSLSEAMGMFITVESRPGEGSTFTLHFATSGAADAVSPTIA